MFSEAAEARLGNCWQAELCLSSWNLSIQSCFPYWQKWVSIALVLLILFCSVHHKLKGIFGSGCKNVGGDEAQGNGLGWANHFDFHSPCLVYCLRVFVGNNSVGMLCHFFIPTIQFHLWLFFLPGMWLFWVSRCASQIPVLSSLYVLNLVCLLFSNGGKTGFHSVQVDGFSPPSLVLVHSPFANPVCYGCRNVFPFCLWPRYLFFPSLGATDFLLCCKSHP